MSWQRSEDSNVRLSALKCVVVGDTAVGKTRLICARACNSFLTVNQMLQTHIPTVWAIDQYRIHQEVLQRSWKSIDGVNVSLRLWDTFGDHEKDRQFAYGRSDVVLLCFSIGSQLSFKHCLTKWYPEIRRNCPYAPIVLVGCKNDLRHIYKDKTFVKAYREKNSFMRLPDENSMITREQGRQMASEIGAMYYEFSAYTQYGLDDVFNNAMRLALVARRKDRFWVSLRNVRSAVLQMPYCPPKPDGLSVQILPSTYEEDMNSLLAKECGSDLTLNIKDKKYKVHRIILAAASSYFKELFISSLAEDGGMVRLEILERLPPSSVPSILKFLYSGKAEIKSDDLADFREIANTIDIVELQAAIINIENEETLEQNLLKEIYCKKLYENVQKMWFEEQLFLDVTFELDDGVCFAHRSILMGRCDVMKAMFSGYFKESTSGIIPFPGVSKEVFSIFLQYLYTDCTGENVDLRNCLEVIELANRLCLPRLITLVELKIVQDLMAMKEKGLNLNDHVFYLLEPCQLHNAQQLADWCQYYIITNYQDISINTPKLLRNLHPDNQARLNKNRWPPVYFLKEQEYYEAHVQEQELIVEPPRRMTWKSAKDKIRQFFCLKPKRRASSSAEKSAATHFK